MKGLLKTKPALSQFLFLVGVTLVSFFLLGLIGTLVLSSISGVGIKDMGDMSKLDFSKPGSITFIRGSQVLQFISLFLVPTFFCARLFSTDSKKYLGLKRPSNQGYFMMGIAVMLLAIPFTNLLGEWNKNVQFPPGIEHWMKKTDDEATKVFTGLLTRHSIKDLIINVLCIAGLAAVGEELLFRGIVQRLLIKLFKSPWAGIIVTAILFSALHLQFYGFLPRFLLGILLGLIYWYSGSLWTAILAHFVYDGFLIVLAYFNPGLMNEESSVKLSNIAVTTTICTAIMVLVIVLMKRKSVTTYEGVYADDSIPVKDHPF